MGVDQCLNQEADIPTSAWDCCIMSSPKCCKLRREFSQVEELDDFGEYHFRSIHETEIHMPLGMPVMAYNASENLDVFLGIPCAAGIGIGWSQPFDLWTSCPSGPKFQGV